MPSKRTPDEQREYMRAYRARQRSAAASVDPGATVTPAAQPEPDPARLPDVRQVRPRGQELVQPVDPQPVPPLPWTASIDGERVNVVGVDTHASRAKWSKVKTAGQAEAEMSAIRRERVRKPRSAPVDGMCVCGNGQPHRHYFTGWFEQMTPAQASTVYNALAAHHKREYERR